MVIENLHAHVLLKFLDRDFAREAVIGAIEANDPGDQAPDERLSLSKDGLQNCLLPLESHDIARPANLPKAAQQSGLLGPRVSAADPVPRLCQPFRPRRRYPRPALRRPPRP